MANFTMTDWILAGGFVILFLFLNQVIGVLNKIHADLLNIESYVARYAGRDSS